MISHGIRPAHSPKKNGIVPPDLSFPVLGHHPAVLDVVVATCEIKVIEGQIDPKFRGDCLKHQKRLGHDFLAYPIARQHGYPVRALLVGLWALCTCMLCD